jgi:hypothetical protein
MGWASWFHEAGYRQDLARRHRKNPGACGTPARHLADLGHGDAGGLGLLRGERDVYICPGGAELTSTGNIDQGHIVYYRANKKDCSACALKPRCTTAAMRKLTRDLNEDVRDSVRRLANTDAFQQSRRERKKVEMRFAHMKRILRLDRLRLRGLSGAKDEVLLTATAQNLRRLVKLLGRAPPFPAACLA